MTNRVFSPKMIVDDFERGFMTSRKGGDTLWRDHILTL